jgi:branched-chain amino acid transport system permease protein
LITAKPRGRMTPLAWAGVAAVLVVLVLAPLLFPESFFLEVLMTRAFWLGLVAASLIFLASYGGMVSLAQVGLYGVGGFMMANLVTADGGLAADWSPWLGVLGGLVLAVLVGLIFGAIAARSEGIYFLMITLAFGVMVYYFFGQVTQLSGFGGVNNVDLPGLIGDPADDGRPLYYVSLGASILAFAAVIYLARTPFGLALQGIRDDPTRMRALGYHVTLHRTLAFGAGALMAGVAGVLSVWYNRRIDPGSVTLGFTIDVLVIAVIGGLYRLEGAWVGAVAFVLLENYARDWLPDVGATLGPERFTTLIGVIFLVIVLVSPGGLVGIWEQARDRFGPMLGGHPPRAGPEAEPAPATGESVDRGSQAAADRPGMP